MSKIVSIMLALCFLSKTEVYGIYARIIFAFFRFYSWGCLLLDSSLCFVIIILGKFYINLSACETLGNYLLILHYIDIPNFPYIPEHILILNSIPLFAKTIKNKIQK